MIYSVVWTGDRANPASGLKLNDVIRCGQVGALWSVGSLDMAEAGRVRARLIPVDPHDVHPATCIPEMPVPNG